MKRLSKYAFKFAMGFVAVAIFLSVPATADARSSAAKTSASKLPSFVRVLSYNEVTRLPKAKRQAYLRGLRSMMTELDRIPKKLRVANESTQYSQIAALLSLFAGEEAHAAALGVPAQTSQGLKCSSGYSTRMVVRQPPGITSVVPKAVCIVGPRQDNKCGSGAIGINARADGTWECATLSSFNLLPENKKSAIRRVPNSGEFLLRPLFGVGGAKNNFINGQPTAEDFAKRWQAQNRPQLRIQLVDPNVQPSHAAAAAVAPLANDQGGTLAQAEERSRRLTAARLAAERARGGAATLPARPAIPPGGTGVAGERARSAEVVTPSAPVGRTDYQAVDNDGSDAIVVTPVASSGIASDQLSNEPQVSDEVEDENSTQASARFGACEPEAAKTCDASSVERARQQYASDPNPDCIYAGSISTYQDGKKRAYKCVAPSQFCFGSNTCTNSTGERLSADYACESNQVICNPLIYGVHSDGESPFCIEKMGAATAACDDESKADEGAVTPLGQDHAGLKEAWNDFADRLFKLCHKNEIAAALHCAECDIISKRLFALNIAARDVENCGAAIKFEDSQCDADGKCQGLPGARARSGGARAVSDADVHEAADGDFPIGTKKFETRGERGVSSVSPSATKANVRSMSDVKAKEVESVFNMPYSRPK